MKKIPSFPAKTFIILFILAGCSLFSFAQQKNIRVLIVPFHYLRYPGAATGQCTHRFTDSISPVQQEAYISLLKKGTPMIFLHHSLVSYQHWPEFIKIVGGQYHTSPVLVNGDTLRANYEHGVTIPVKVEQKNHPVTRGICAISPGSIITGIQMSFAYSWATARPLIPTRISGN